MLGVGFGLCCLGRRESARRPHSAIPCTLLLFGLGGGELRRTDGCVGAGEGWCDRQGSATQQSTNGGKHSMRIRAFFRKKGMISRSDPVGRYLRASQHCEEKNLEKSVSELQQTSTLLRNMPGIRQRTQRGTHSQRGKP